MKKLIPFTLIAALVCSVGVASADHRNRGRDHDRGWHGDGGRGGIVVRDRGYRDVRVRREVRVRPRFEHRTVYVSDGAFRFDGGVVRRWRAPVIRHRYFDVRVRPTPVVEYYDPMPGYVWIAGQWQWTGAEWQWLPGHYEVSADYRDGYDQGYGPAYEQPYGGQGYYDQGYYDEDPAPRYVAPSPY